MNARFSIRAARLESREMMTVVPFFRVLAQAIATLALSSGVMSTLARPATPSRPNRLRAPRDSQTIEELMVAPASTVLNGYTFTPAPITAFSPTKHSSPSTEPSSQRALRRRSLARPDHRAPEPHALGRGRRSRGRRPARGRRRRAPARCRRARCSRRCGRRRRPGSPAPMTAEPSILASGWISAPSPSHTPSLSSKPGIVDLDLAVEHVLVGRHVGLERADVLPVALGDRAEQRQALGEQLREHLAGEVDRPVGLDVVEDLGLEHEDAGVDGVAEHLAPRGLLEEALDGAVLVGDDDAELERVLDRGQPDGGQRLVLVVEVDDLVEVDVGEHVAGDHEEALVELVHGVADRAGRAERLLLGGVDHPHAELGAVAEVGADVVGQEGDGDHDLVEAVALQQLDDVLHHRPVGQRQHRLRGVRRQRTQPAALAARHDHGLHGVEPTPGGPVGPTGPERLRGPSGTYMTSEM